MLPPEDHLHIEEIMERPQEVAKLVAQQKLEAPKPKKKYVAFKHPSGKTGPIFLLEYITEHKQARWAELGKYIQSLGFAQSSVNNGISRLLEDGKIEKIGPALYAIPKKSHEKKVV